MARKLEIRCPAGADVHPVLSPNPLDVVCRIQGGLRPARGPDGEAVVCCSEYTRCRIWTLHKDIENGPSTKAQRDQTRSEPHRHTLQHARRDELRI